MTITAHCLVKNEENFVGYAIKSVINFVDKVIVFDTGSTDKTVSIIQELVKEYPDKIIFEEKGECDKKRHTELRNEMIGKTNTDWFMILDGDEIWPENTLTEAAKVIAQGRNIECLMAYFHLCVGDVYHETIWPGSVNALGRIGHFYQRFIKKTNGVHWQGDYNADTIYNKQGGIFFNDKNTAFLKNKFLHATHLKRSSVLDDYSSGGTRKQKMVLTYFIIGKKITNDWPEVLSGCRRLGFFKSFINFFIWVYSRVIFKFGFNI